ncbi:PEP-CTERM sorting domain-containing protein [Psychromonas sp. KJ10-2]|uniref:PEP-CTERM sorting domain-containing protein n=1 Tax=Psychromonas sp. KJ10-2 TaxID=3391822 RepID=UPI0039B6D54E
MLNILKLKKMMFVLGFLFSSQLFATTIVDTVNQNEYVGWWDSYSYTHDLNDDGFVLGSALSGTLEVSVADDGGYFDLWETILFTVEDFDFDTGGVTFGNGFSGDLEVNALGALNSDGYLDIIVSSVFGDFYVGDSVLTVEVPAPGMFLLFGFAALGIAVGRKKRQS